MSSQLALFGGEPVRTRPFPRRATMGVAERDAVLAVMDRGEISAFFGSPGEQFLGGPVIREFEERWAEAFGYRHAVTVNSWTAGLTTSIGAARLGPGDEVITSPYTMSASATCALFYGAIPVFADIDPETFGLDPASVEAAVTPRTRAIVAVHLFGLPCDLDALRAIADRHDLVLIEDAAQSPLATYGGRPVGAVRDIGGFSLNYHKHVHTGEGGVIVTDDDDLADRCRLIRNHGENAVEAWGIKDLTNMIGGNYRLTELQAAIGLAQLDRLPDIIQHRQRLASRVAAALSGCELLRPATVPGDRTHSFYVYPFRFLGTSRGIARARFVDAVNAELPKPQHVDDIPMSGGYLRPLYLSPLYQQRVAIGSEGFPFNLVDPDDDRYRPGACPTVERVQEEEMVLSFLVRDPLDEADVDDLVRAVEKVTEAEASLRG